MWYYTAILSEDEVELEVFYRENNQQIIRLSNNMVLNLLIQGSNFDQFWKKRYIDLYVYIVNGCQISQMKIQLISTCMTYPINFLARPFSSSTFLWFWREGWMWLCQSFYICFLQFSMLFSIGPHYFISGWLAGTWN